MGLVQDVWNGLKTWRSLQLGPVSIVYRFRRTVTVSRNRSSLSARTQGVALGLQSVSNPIGLSFFAAPSAKNPPQKVADGSEVAVIFGVGPGLGFALARKLVLEGHLVAMVSRQADHLHDLVLELNVLPTGGRATVYSCDATDERGVREVLSRVERELGIPSLVVYSMQETVAGQATELTTAAFEDCWRTNCLGAFLVAREAAKLMSPQKRGSIILIGSTSGLIGREGHLSLAVGKFGLRAVTQVMARELWRDGLHVAHVVIDADIDEPGKAADEVACDPNDVAAVIHSVHRQPKSAWASEIDVRPAAERFWEHC